MMRLGHVVFVVRDLDTMVDFYVSKLGLHVTDRGHTRGRVTDPRSCFFRSIETLSIISSP